jgi:hypothetical protein
MEKEKDTTTLARFQFDYSILSIPEPKTFLYKLLPSLPKHLPDFPIEGPYCFGNDAKRGYAIHLSIDTSAKKENATSWTYTKGCVSGLPCWYDDHPSNSTIPDSGGGGSNIAPAGRQDDMTQQALFLYGFYFLVIGLLLSLACNCQLSRKLKQQRHTTTAEHSSPVQVQTRSPPQPTTTTMMPRSDLEEPLLPASSPQPAAAAATTLTEEEEEEDV